MILYSIVSPQQVYGAFSNTPMDYLNREGLQNNSLSEFDDGRVKLLGYYNGENFIIDRIISTNPSDFLNPIFQPGQILRK